VADQIPWYLRRLRGLPPELQGLAPICRTRSYSPTRISGRHPTVRSEILRRSNRNSLEEGDPSPHDDFDPPIIQDYSSEDESQHSPVTNFETENELEMITNSLERLNLRNSSHLNPHPCNKAWFNMSGEMIIPPAGGTSTSGSSVGNSPSTSGTLFSFGTTSGTTSEVFSNPTGGPFLYKMLPITGPSNYFGTFQSYFFNNTVGINWF